MIITDLLQTEMGYLNSLNMTAVSFCTVFVCFCIAVYMCGYLVSYLSITDWTSGLALTAKVYI